MTKRLLKNFITYNFIVKPIILYFLVTGPFHKKQDFFEEITRVLKTIPNSIKKEKDLGFFCIIENIDLDVLKTSYKMKFLILRKYVFYVLKDLKTDINNGTL